MRRRQKHFPRFSIRGSSHRLSRVQKRFITIFIVLAVVLVLWWRNVPLQHAPQQQIDAGFHHVARVIDGDTLLLSNGARVRLIGANTPETVKSKHPVEPWGTEATQFTHNFISPGKVRLEFDGPRKDKYGRFLAHVWVGDRVLSEELLRAGLARATTGFPYSSRMKQRFLAAQAVARTAGRGIWGH